MCGFVGWVSRNPSTPVDRGILETMSRSLNHRGPDESGLLIRGNVGLAHARLRIIDLSPKARQPMGNEDGQIQVLFNGEIYNFPSLREELEGLGHRFESHSDTEVIVHAFETWGTAAFARFDGMFSSAICDFRSRSLVFVRDPYGKKPLYVWENANGLFFASEIKAFFAHPDFSRKLDPSVLLPYLTHDFIPTPQTPFVGCRKLRQGAWERHSLDGSSHWSGESKRFWEPCFEPKNQGGGEEIRAEFCRLFGEAVRKRLMSQVPLGVFLSGGLDSSAIVSFMADILPGDRIKTFSIGFTEDSFDESPHAETIARQFGTEHHLEFFSHRQLLDAMDPVIGCLDEPLADPSILPTWLLSGFARKHVTVCLGGDGGDELFAGYDPFLALPFARLFECLPTGWHRCCQRLASFIPSSDLNLSLQFKVHHFLKGFAEYSRGRPALLNARWMGALTPEEANVLIQSAVKTPRDWRSVLTLDVKSDADSRADHSRWKLDSMVRHFVDGYMHDDILVKVDRASMMNSLEVRAPFLDKALSEFVHRLPASYKMCDLTRKSLLRSVLRGRIPDHLIDRPKKGFGIPLAGWFKGPLKEVLLETLEPSRLDREGVFRGAEVRKLLDQHLSGAVDHRKALWALFVWERWRRNHGFHY